MKLSRDAANLRSGDISIHRVSTSNESLLDRVDDDVIDHPVRPDVLADFLANASNVPVVAMVKSEVIGMATGLLCGSGQTAFVVHQ